MEEGGPEEGRQIVSHFASVWLPTARALGSGKQHSGTFGRRTHDRTLCGTLRLGTAWPRCKGDTHLPEASRIVLKLSEDLLNGT